LEQIKQAAAILARYSKAKKENEAEVIYGPRLDYLPHCLTVQPAREIDITSLKF
jgi:hypothetical protein